MVGYSHYTWQYLVCLLYRKGDLDEFHKHGSLHQYLLHLHQNGHQPINTFWWGKQRVVSICSPELFKDTTKLINRPSKKLKYVASCIVCVTLWAANYCNFLHSLLVYWMEYFRTTESTLWAYNRTTQYCVC